MNNAAIPRRDPGAGHAAPGQALGYLYQFDLALLELIRASATQPSIGTTLELLDDVAFEVGGDPTELLQVKHHLNRAASLSDRSADLWRTIGSWLDVVQENHLSLDQLRLTLVTTSTASPGSAAASLRRGPGRDVGLALKRIRAEAADPPSDATGDSYRAFARLSLERQEQFVSSMTVADRAPAAEATPDTIAQEVRFATEPQFRSALVDRLLGWWHRRVLGHLSGDRTAVLAYQEVEQVIADLRDQFKADNLPIDILTDDPGLARLSADDRMFVMQLQLIALGTPALEIAIRDYKRAFLQRQRWLEDGLVAPEELARYEDKLLDEWEHIRALAPQEMDEPQQVAFGVRAYERTQGLTLWIRDRCQEPFVLRGTYHMMSEELRVGWHPDFVARLRGLIGNAA